MTLKMATGNNFQQAWRQLTPQLRRIVKHKIDRLVENPAHPSLKVHRIRQAKKDIRICYISNNMRLLYEYREGILYLWDLGSHSIVDRVQQRRFAP